jgi:polyisoprenoid-binding protein YceI
MFEVNRFPKACLRLTGLEALGQEQEREAVVAGLLNLHGVERPLKVKGTLRQEGNLYRFRGSFLLRLGDYGLEAPTFLFMRVAEEVKVWVEVEAR